MDEEMVGSLPVLIERFALLFFALPVYMFLVWFFVFVLFFNRPGLCKASKNLIKTQTCSYPWKSFSKRRKI